MKSFIKTVAWIFFAVGGLVVVTNLWTIAVGVWNKDGKTSATALLNEPVIFILVGIGLIGTGWFLFGHGAENFKEYCSFLIGFFVNHKWWIMGAGAFSVLGSFLLLGMPGAGLMYAADVVINPLIVRPQNWAAAPGDSAWPMALCLTIFIPWAYFGLFLLSKHTFHSAATIIHLLFSAVATGGVVLLIQIIYRFANRNG